MAAQDYISLDDDDDIWNFHQDFNSYDLPIEEIALRLSRMYRYCCKGKYPITVAQHSCMVALLLSKELRKQALAHEFIEVKIGEIIGMLKDKIPAIKELEDKALSIVLPKYGLPPKLNDKVIEADHQIVIVENQAMKSGFYTFSAYDRDYHIPVWKQHTACRTYLDYWNVYA